MTSWCRTNSGYKTRPGRRTATAGCRANQNKIGVQNKLGSTNHHHHPRVSDSPWVPNGGTEPHGAVHAPGWAGFGSARLGPARRYISAQWGPRAGTGGAAGPGWAVQRCPRQSPACATPALTAGTPASTEPLTRRASASPPRGGNRAPTTPPGSQGLGWHCPPGAVPTALGRPLISALWIWGTFA